MLSFLSLSSLVGSSAYGTRPGLRAEKGGDFWESLSRLGFNEETMLEAGVVLEPGRWQSANRKLGDTVSYIAVDEQEEGIPVALRGPGNFFVGIMQQFCESLLAELEGLESTEAALPALSRAVEAAATPQAREEAYVRLHASQSRILHYQALIPARLSEFRQWAQTYDLLPEAGLFFGEYTQARQGEAMSLEALFERFTVS